MFNRKRLSFGVSKSCHVDVIDSAADSAAWILAVRPSRRDSLEITGFLEKTYAKNMKILEPSMKSNSYQPPKCLNLCLLPVFFLTRLFLWRPLFNQLLGRSRPNRQQTYHSVPEGYTAKSKGIILSLGLLIPVHRIISNTSIFGFPLCWYFLYVGFWSSLGSPTFYHAHVGCESLGVHSSNILNKGLQTTTIKSYTNSFGTYCPSTNDDICIYIYIYNVIQYEHGIPI